MSQTVHVLFVGRAMCGFSPDPPPGWPDDHKSVDLDADPAQINCKKCRARRDHWHAKNTVSDDSVRTVERSRTTQEAADLVLKRPVEYAAATIDRLIPVAAQAVLLTLEAMSETNEHARKIVILAKFIGVCGRQEYLVT